MIHLTKGPKPEILELNAAAWTAELIAALQAGGQLSDARKARYNNPNIKQPLLGETHKKCAYCESNFLHVAPGHIEHVAPKKPHPELSYEWTNLTIACDICNTNKGVKEGLFDPYDQPPNQLFRFRGPMMLADPNSEVARATVVTLDLNRTPLLEKRREKIEELELRLVEILKANNEAARKLLIQALLDDARKPGTQYSACVTEHVNSLKADGHLPLDIH